MTTECPQYRVRALLRNHDEMRVGNGPFDYRGNALEYRNGIFAYYPNVIACWIEKEGVPTGARLKRA